MWIIYDNLCELFMIILWIIYDNICELFILYLGVLQEVFKKKAFSDLTSNLFGMSC